MTATDRERALTGETPWGALALGVTAWLVAAIFFFPVFWMVLNGFKEEADANGSPRLFFEPTLDRFRDVTAQTPGLLGFGEAFSSSFWITELTSSGLSVMI